MSDLRRETSAFASRSGRPVGRVRHGRLLDRERDEPVLMGLKKSWVSCGRPSNTHTWAATPESTVHSFSQTSSLQTNVSSIPCRESASESAIFCRSAGEGRVNTRLHLGGANHLSISP